MVIGNTIANIQRIKVKALEHAANVWVIVDAEHHLAFAAAHESGHPLVALKRKVNAVTGGLPIRRGP